VTDFIPDCEDLSVEELDEKLEEAVLAHERSQCHVSFYLLAMNEKGGFQQFGFTNIFDYCADRFGYSYRMTGYMLGLGRKVKHREKIADALNRREISWTKAYKIASVATDEDEEMWLEAAKSLSVRMLDRKIKDNIGENYKGLRFSLSEDQAAVVEYALEICRRMGGAELTPEQCLEYMASEFLATYAQPVEEALESGSENGELPSTAADSSSEDSQAVFARDNWVCSYPGCSSRSMLHDHHIRYRSQFGSKSEEECHALSNRTCLCVLHHKWVHSGIVSVKGEAPDNLKWGRPKILEEAIARFERKRQAEEEEEADRRWMLEVSERSYRKTFSEFAGRNEDTDFESSDDDEDDWDEKDDVNPVDWTVELFQ
jgi:hypothetical protein